MFNSFLPDIADTPSSRRPGEAFFASLSRTLDTLLIAAMLALPMWLHVGTWSIRYTATLLTTVIIFHALSGPLNVYHPWRGEALSHTVSRVALAWGATVFVLLLVGYILRETAAFSRIVFSAWFLTTPLVLLAWRVAVRHILERLLERRGSTRDALIWGSGQTAAQLGEALRSGRTLGLRLADHIEPIASVDRLAESTSTDSSAAPLSQTESLELRARRGDYSVLYIVLGSLSKQEASDLIERLSDTTVSVYLVPDYFSMQLFRGRWTSLGRIPLLTVFDTADGSAGSWVKRMEDLVLGTLMLLLVSLPMMLIAAMVKLTSRGPVLSGLRYYDRIGQPITLWKFRTEKTKKTIPQQHHEDTANITPIGRLLRKSRLDELPLLINLIRGDISIVGPRLRETAYDCDDSRSLGSQRLRTRFKPGLLSCEQTASFREGSESSRSREAIDPILWYTRNWTPWLDLKIIWSSIWKAVS